VKIGGGNSHRIGEISGALIPIVFYGFGLFSAYYYFTLGLRIVRIISFLFVQN
jgi:hypothetical protein